MLMRPATALKNADDMLKAIIGIVDTSGDGKIQFEGGFGDRREAGRRKRVVRS